jgi:hypothetical protein
MSASSARAFSSASRFSAAAGSKMPPQQIERALDVVDDQLCLGTHDDSYINFCAPLVAGL